MLRFLILAVLGFAAFVGYNHYVKPPTVGPDGQPLSLLFTFDGCGEPCDATRKFLHGRVELLEVLVNNNSKAQAQLESYGGGRTLPYVVLGDERVTGASQPGLLAALIRARGISVANSLEQKALGHNFDNQGKPQLVMYSTQWCGYCNKARDHFAAEGFSIVERDIEQDRVAKRDYDALGGHGTPLLYFGYQTATGFHSSNTPKALGI